MKRSFTSKFVQELLETVSVMRQAKSSPAQMARFSCQLEQALEVYNHARVSANSVRAEIKNLSQLASKHIEPPDNYLRNPSSANARRYNERVMKQFEDVQQAVMNLSDRCRELLVKRCRGRGITLFVDTDKLRPTNTLDVTSKLSYCREIAALTQTGRRLRPGKNRPRGKKSRPAPHIDIYAPPAQEHPSWRSAEREFEAYLAVAWLELTGGSPRQDAHYVDFLEIILEEVGVEADVLLLLRKANQAVQEKHREDAIAAIGRLPPDIPGATLENLC